MSEATSTERKPDRAVVFHPQFARQGDMLRDAEGQLQEAVGLALAIDLEIAGAEILPINTIRPATLIGTGKIEELKAYIEEVGANLAIINTSLSPSQQRNLEKAWNCKVIDRTALILEIFAARARTNEGKLQVELAMLTYQKSRLVRSWTHLERQRGGFGFTGGPGETQIEIDRRLIRDRIARLRKELDQVVRTRELHRKSRRDAPYPVVALVGYTNAGKSTLFNRLTGATVEAVDKLFATLDPTMRAIKLPSSATVILSDTVGFVSNLPTALVAAFRATLEEVIEADVILHVRDISHAETEAQKQDVEKVLSGLFKEDDARPPMIEVLNKIDALDEEARTHMLARYSEGTEEAVAISALDGTGIEALLQHLQTRLDEAFFVTARLRLNVSEGKQLAWLYRHGSIIEQKGDGEILFITAKLTQENLERFQRMQQNEAESAN